MMILSKLKPGRARPEEAFFLVAASLMAVWVEPFDLLHDYTRHHEVWELDEVFTVMLAAGLPLFLLRWNRSLAQAHRHSAEAEAEAQRIALHVSLTGLPNRRSFQQRVETVAVRRDDRGRPLIAILLDLDRFKPMNDLRGHLAGDLLLCEVARRLRRICPEEALIVRLGGDEFVVAVDGKDAEDHGGGLARGILDGISQPFDFGDWSATIGCSVGIAEWSEGMSPADLLSHADQAMYRAKQAGRGRCGYYDEALGASLREQAALEQDLRRTLAEGGLEPHFQPIYDITGRELRGFEVLARWAHPVHGFVPPTVFITLAEELGLIDPLSDLVLDRACAALAGWPTTLPISFNLSPRQLSDAGLPRRILAIIARHGIPGSRLEIEITERAVLTDFPTARSIIAELAAAGVRVALDDFGTGTSSLAMLTELPIDGLKIDRSFIGDVDRLPHKGKVVSGVLALAQSLGLDVTAEGIEREEKLAFLTERSCALGQGYLLGRPQPAEATAALLSKAPRVAPKGLPQRLAV